MPSATPTNFVISAILAHPRRADRVTVHVDRGRRLGAAVVDQRPLAVVSLQAVQRLGVRCGDEATPELCQQLEAEARALLTYDRATAMLARGPRASRDLRQRLLRKGDLPADVDAALQRLKEIGVLDDEAFARHVARCLLGGGRKASAGVQGDLQRRGVPRELAERATREVAIEEQVDEAGSALELARRRLRSLQSLDPLTQRRRLSAYLQRRGFKTPQVMAAVAAVLSRSPSP